MHEKLNFNFCKKQLSTNLILFLSQYFNFPKNDYAIHEVTEIKILHKNMKSNNSNY